MGLRHICLRRLQIHRRAKGLLVQDNRLEDPRSEHLLTRYNVEAPSLLSISGPTECLKNSVEDDRLRAQAEHRLELNLLARDSEEGALLLTISGPRECWKSLQEYLKGLLVEDSVEDDQFRAQAKLPQAIFEDEGAFSVL